MERPASSTLPTTPGIYIYKDAQGRIIYVGKAKSLRKRVSSYFVQSKEHSAKVRVLVRQIAEAHGGTVQFRQGASHGLEVSISLPTSNA